jgi:phage-related protein
MVPAQSNWTVEFHTTARGSSPVVEFINGLTEEEQAKIRNHLRLLREFGTDLGMPQVKPVSGHKPLWELRPLPNRLLYFAYTGRRMIILHAFPKRRGRIPPRDIATAERRLAEFLRREK